MAKPLREKLNELVMGAPTPKRYQQYGDVVIPWYTQLWRSIRPPSKVPRERQPMSGKQRRMIIGVLSVIVLGAGGWTAYSYFTGVKERSMELFNEGMRQLGPNNLTGAKESFTAAIELWPENARAYLERGNVNRILGDNVGATEDWTRAIELNPNLSDAYTARATMYRLDGNLARALTDLNRAIEIGPTMDAYYERGQVFFAQGDYQKALEDYDRSIDQQPNAPYVYRSRAAAKEQLGDIEGSRNDERTADRLERIR